jgi:hypothetical protein
LSKSLEFLTNKKFDVEIPKYFMNQLSLFENRLNKTGMPLTTNFDDEPEGISESDELMIRNTFLNGLPMKNAKKTEKPLKLGRRLQWADGNKNKKDLLCSFHNKDILLNHKDIKPIVSHKGQRPNKTILKRSNSVEVTGKRIRLDSATPSSNRKDVDTSSASSSFINNSSITNSELKNSFLQKEEDPAMSERKKDGETAKSQSEVTNIIIAPNMKSFINNNIKNIYINNNTDIGKLTNSFIEGSKENTQIPTAKTSNTRDTIGGLASKSNTSLSNMNPSSKVSGKTETKSSALQNNFSITNLIE